MPSRDMCIWYAVAPGGAGAGPATSIGMSGDATLGASAYVYSFPPLSLLATAGRAHAEACVRVLIALFVTTQDASDSDAQGISKPRRKARGGRASGGAARGRGRGKRGGAAAKEGSVSPDFSGIDVDMTGGNSNDGFPSQNALPTVSLRVVHTLYLCSSGKAAHVQPVHENGLHACHRHAKVPLMADVCVRACVCVCVSSGS